MKTVIAGFILAASFIAAPAVAQSEPAAPRVIAVKFHADWCPACQAMGSIYEDLEAQHESLPVLFVTFDVTDDHKKAQAAYLANTLGLTDLWIRSNGRTGVIALVNAETKQLIRLLTSRHDIAEMGAALTDAVSGASM